MQLVHLNVCTLTHKVLTLSHAQQPDKMPKPEYLKLAKS